MTLRLHNYQCFCHDTITRRVANKGYRLPPPIGQTSPRRTPTWYFMVSGGAGRYYTLLKGDMEVVTAKGSLILPRQNSTTRCSFMLYPGRIIIMIYIWYTLMSYIVCLSINGVIFLNFDNMFLQNSSTSLRILVECNSTVICNSTVLVFIPISFSHFGNLDGAVPSAPIITGITFTFFSTASSVPFAKSWYFCIFSFSFSSTLVSYGTSKSIIWHLLPFFSTMITSGRLASITWSVCIEQSHRILYSSFSHTGFGFSL